MKTPTPYQVEKAERMNRENAAELAKLKTLERPDFRRLARLKKSVKAAERYAREVGHVFTASNHENGDGV